MFWHAYAIGFYIGVSLSEPETYLGFILEVTFYWDVQKIHLH